MFAHALIVQHVTEEYLAEACLTPWRKTKVNGCVNAVVFHWASYDNILPMILANCFQHRFSLLNEVPAHYILNVPT